MNLIQTLKTTSLLLLTIIQYVNAQTVIPVFNQTRAFNYLEKQCAFGPRYPGSEGHQKCLAYFLDELEKYADSVIQQPFPFFDPKSYQLYRLTNIIASFGNHSKRILLCAHWDTRPWADNDPNPQNRDRPILGANDGASGVAVLLEIAHVLKTNPPSIGVDIVLFDGEDSGIQGQTETWCQGSRFFGQSKCLVHLPMYGILLDFVGDKDLHFPVEINSHRFAPEIVDLVWGKAFELGLPAFDRSLGYEMIDDHLELLKVGIPAVDIIDFDYPYYHTLEDTEDKCSPESLGIVGTLLLHLIYEH
jgi:glutaminyl-peptide cyclotransferase